MTLRIGELVFTPADLQADKKGTLQKAFSALRKSPEAVLSKTLYGAETIPSRVLAKEKEMVFVNAAAGYHLIGTLEQWECVSLIAYDQNKGFYGLIHVNESSAPIAPFLERFSGKENVQVVLVGGRFDQSCHVSLRNICKILTTLIISEQTFTVAAQKLMGCNEIQDDGMRRYIKDELLRQAGLLYEQVLEKPFPTQWQYDFDAEDFHEKSNRVLDFLDGNFLAIYNLLNCARILPPKKDYEAIRAIKGDAEKREAFEVNLQNVLMHLFSKEGLTFLKRIGCVFDKKGFPALRHYVFNVHTSALHELTDKETPFKLEREIYVYDPHKPEEYFCAFLGYDYCRPSLSLAFRHNIISLQPMLANGVLDEAIAKKFEQTFLINNKDEQQSFALAVIGLQDCIAPTVCPQLWSWKTLPNINIPQNQLFFSANQL